MSWVDDLLEEFGRSLGMQDLRLREDGKLVLDMERLGTLAVELVGLRQDEVAVSLCRRIEMPSAPAWVRALELCHYRSPAPWPVRCGWSGPGNLVFAVVLDRFEFTLPHLNQAIDWLDGLHRQMEPLVRLA
jgi:type III secretion system chaperone SycN